MNELDDIVLGFGESDEYSFLFRKSTDLYQRREAKIVSTVVSLFTSAYVYYWRDYFTDSARPKYPPIFDGRAVLYPSEVEVKDYFAWRQADTHINNLFNTSFWALVEQGKMSPRAAEVKLSVSHDLCHHAIFAGGALHVISTHAFFFFVNSFWILGNGFEAKELDAV